MYTSPCRWSATARHRVLHRTSMFELHKRVLFGKRWVVYTHIALFVSTNYSLSDETDSREGGIPTTHKKHTVAFCDKSHFMKGFPSNVASSTYGTLCGQTHTKFNVFSAIARLCAWIVTHNLKRNYSTGTYLLLPLQAGTGMAERGEDCWG